MNESNYAKETQEITEGLAISHPDYLYEGGISADEDEMDYVNFSIKAVRVG